MDQKIQIFIHRLRRRLGIQKAIYIFPVFLSIGFFIGFLHLLFGYFRPFYYAEIMGTIWAFASFLFGNIYFFLHFPKEREVAHTGDKVIGQERLLTALELRGKNETISCLQKEDTIAHIKKCNIKESFPYQLKPKQLLLCFFSVFLFFLFLYLPSEAKSEAERLHKLRQEAKTEAALLEDIKQELQKEAATIKASSSIPETTGEKLAAFNKFNTVNNLLDDTKGEYSSADSKQDLEKAKERLKVKLENIAENAISSDEKNAISDLMERIGFSSYKDSSDHHSNDTGNTKLSNDNSAADNDKKAETEKGSQTDNTNGTSNQNQNTELEDNHRNDASNSNNSNSSINSSNNQNNSNGNNTNDHDSQNDSNNNSNNNGNSNDSDRNLANNSENHYKNKSELNDTNDKNFNQEPSENNSKTGENSSPDQKASNDAGKRNSSTSGTGKNYGNKNGIERKTTTKKPKEKIMEIKEAMGDDENLTGTTSQDGNSYQKSSNQQLDFGTKKNIEEIAGEYAENAFTALDNNSIPYYMKNVVETYFNSITNNS